MSRGRDGLGPKCPVTKHIGVDLPKCTVKYFRRLYGEINGKWLPEHLT